MLSSIERSTSDMIMLRGSGLNGVNFERSIIPHDQLSNNRSRRITRNSQPNTSSSRFAGTASVKPGPLADFPLRLLVQNDMVGAIIGRQGSTIRTITQQSRARVDVHRKENIGSLEKAITVYGNPENCTTACKRILEVMQEESRATNKGDICLKILAHNNLIGRIIGKNGNTIKGIMQDTDTKISVSSISEINSFNLERIITIKGSIDNISRAESQISSKLRQSYENDLQVLSPQMLMFPGLHPLTILSTPSSGMTFNPNMPFGPCAGFPMTKTPPTVVASSPTTTNDEQETTHLYIPNNAVGAIIGAKGSYIRSIMRYANSTLKIAALDDDRPDEKQTDRKVIIIGTAEGQWKAQYMIYEKMREEGFICGDEVKLTVEILVASSQVGRIIGKGGQNVRELQRVTGSIIKLPAHAVAVGVSVGDEETPIHIIGPFYASQSAQRRIRALMTSTSSGHSNRRQKSSVEQNLNGSSAGRAGFTLSAATENSI